MQVQLARLLLLFLVSSLYLLSASRAAKNKQLVYYDDYDDDDDDYDRGDETEEDNKGKTMNNSPLLVQMDERRINIERIMEGQRDWYRRSILWYAKMSAWRAEVESLLRQEIKWRKGLLAAKGGADDDDENKGGKEVPEASAEPGRTLPMPRNQHVQENNKRCDRSWKLENGPITITSPAFYSDGVYPDSSRCRYQIFGDKSCQPSISCSIFDIRRLDACLNEYLEISDGVGQAYRFCGKSGPRAGESWLSKKATRDLYLKFVSDTGGADRNMFREGFHCVAKCNHLDKKSPRLKVLTPALNPPSIEDKCHCGVGGNEKDRIVGGKSAVFNSYPWQAAIVEKGTRTPFCGGSLINDRFVLTASHCFPPGVDTNLPQNIDVLIHAHVLEASEMDTFDPLAVKGDAGWVKAEGWNLPHYTDDDESTHRYPVKEIIQHPLYQNGKFDYDVTLLRLADRVKMTEVNNPIPVCLPPPGTYEPYEDINATVVGWGLADENAGTTTRILQELTVPTLSLDKCRSWLPKSNITERMLCAGFKNGQQDACRADSGGPLMRRVNSKYWEQIGIVSWGVGCARRKKPGFYARVTELNQWIRSTANSYGAKWCARPEQGAPNWYEEEQNKEKKQTVSHLN